MTVEAPETAWSICDGAIAALWEKLATADPVRAEEIRTRIDGWLDYRLEHGPEDAPK